MGRTQESLTESQRALELDPLDAINGHQSWHYYYAHQYDQSIEKCQKMLQIDSNSFWAHFETAAVMSRRMYKELSLS
jgi:hypothetical protein